MLNKKFVDAATQSASIGEITSLISGNEYAGNLSFMLPLTQNIIVIYFIDNTMCHLIFNKEPLENGKTQVKVGLRDYTPIKKTRAFGFEKLLSDLEQSDTSGYSQDISDAVIQYLHKQGIIKKLNTVSNTFFLKFEDGSLFCGLVKGTRSFIFPDCPLDIDDTEQLAEFVKTQDLGEKK